MTLRLGIEFLALGALVVGIELNDFIQRKRRARKERRAIEVALQRARLDKPTAEQKARIKAKLLARMAEEDIAQKMAGGYEKGHVPSLALPQSEYEEVE